MIRPAGTAATGVTRMNLRDPRTVAQLDRMLKAVQRRPHSSQELKELLGLTDHRRVRLYADQLIAHSRIHIGRWLDTGGPKVPVYRRGPGKPAPYPAPLTEAERRRNWLTRMRMDPDRIDQYDRYLAKDRVRRRKVQPDPLTAWIPRKKD